MYIFFVLYIYIYMHRFFSHCFLKCISVCTISFSIIVNHFLFFSTCRFTIHFKHYFVNYFLLNVFWSCSILFLNKYKHEKSDRIWLQTRSISCPPPLLLAALNTPCPIQIYPSSWSELSRPEQCEPMRFCCGAVPDSEVAHVSGTTPSLRQLPSLASCCARPR